MKKRLLAMLLSLVLVVSLLPVGALAADDGPCLPNGYNNSTSASISFSVPIVDAYKLLLQANESLSASDELPNIKNIVIKLKEEHPNPVVGDTLTLRKIGHAGNLTDYFWYENGLNRGHKLEPSNIDKLVIYYKISGDEKAAEVQAKDLCLWYAKDGSIADYEISSYKSGTQIVVFCDNGESTDTSQGGYSIYAVRLVTSGKNLGENMPDPPDRISYDFVSWNTSPNGTGDIFNENTNVSSDIIVYARKVSSGGTHSGLQIRVMNDNNKFLTRFVELYNAKYNDNLTLDNIDKDILDSMKVVVNGYIDGQPASTNPDYYVSGVQHNGWADGYYKVYNRNASAIAGGQLSNDHIAINDITSITVTAKIKGTPVDVKMNRGSGAGEFEVSTSGLDAWWLIKFAGSPDKPESADLEGPDGILADSTVTVTCTTNEDHQTATYGLLSNSYEIGEVKATADGGYECTITVEPDMYVEEYGDDHALAEGETSEDITLVWDLNNNSWTVPVGATPVKFNVTCDEPAPAPKLSVEKKVELPEGKKTAEVGDVLTYTITVTNSGNTTLTDVVVTDTLTNAAGSVSLETSNKNITIKNNNNNTATIGSLAPGAEVQITAKYTVLEADAGKTISNTAVAESGTTWDEPDTPPSVTVENPSLLISKTVSGMTGPKNTAKIGDVLTYTITVTNDGNVNLGKVTVEDEMMPTTITVDGVEKTIGGGGHVIENLDANENVVITYKYTVPDTLYPIKNTASATANDGTQAKIEISTDVYNPDMTVDKTVNKPVAEVGDTIKYTITVTNTGNVELTNVAVTDKMFVSADGAIQVPNGAKLDGNTVTISTLGVGETATITYTYTVLYWDEGDRIENTATVTSNETGTDPIKVTVVVRVKEIDTVTPPVTEPEEEFVPKWLNTEDHYAYIVGYEDGTIKPNNDITRAEVATIFFRLLTDNARERYWSTTNDFSDVAAESWYNNAISTLSNMGIINGYEDGTFKPNAPITRAEFTAIATRFFDYEAEYDGAFNDVSARAWYADYVQAAVDMGLVDGYPDGGFHPDAYITRAEACTIVNRVLHRVPHEDHLLAESVMNTWPDNPKSAWYYEDMQEATNSHDYDWIRVDGETVEDWTKKLPERDWSALETEWATAYSR